MKPSPVTVIVANKLKVMNPKDNNSLLPAFCKWWQAGKARSEALTQYVADETGHTEMPLSEMRPGDFGHVLSLCPSCEQREHLLELGFTSGTEITVVRLAPLGDPMTVQIRGYQLSLRRREAEAVTMRRCPPEFDLPEFDLDGA